MIENRSDVVVQASPNTQSGLGHFSNQRLAKTDTPRSRLQIRPPNVTLVKLWLLLLH